MSLIHVQNYCWYSYLFFFISIKSGANPPWMTAMRLLQSAVNTTRPLGSGKLQIRFLSLQSVIVVKKYQFQALCFVRSYN